MLELTNQDGKAVVLVGTGSSGTKAKVMSMAWNLSGKMQGNLGSTYYSKGLFLHYRSSKEEGFIIV